MVAPSIAGAMTIHNVAYDSTPVKGTVSVPSMGPEAYSFDQIGNEVLLRPHSTVGHVKVTMVSFACQSGQWNSGESRYMGRDHALHNGIAQTISFPVNRHLANDVVWTVGYNTNTSGLHPIGHSGPMDSLNVGLSPATRLGHDRFPDSIIWDTRVAGFAGGSPFVAGELNLDSHGWAGYVPAARFTVR